MKLMGTSQVSTAGASHLVRTHEGGVHAIRKCASSASQSPVAAVSGHSFDHSIAQYPLRRGSNLAAYRPARASVPPRRSPLPLTCGVSGPAGRFSSDLPGTRGCGGAHASPPMLPDPATESVEGSGAQVPRVAPVASRCRRHFRSAEDRAWPARPRRVKVGLHCRDAAPLRVPFSIWHLPLQRSYGRTTWCLTPTVAAVTRSDPPNRLRAERGEEGSQWHDAKRPKSTICVPVWSRTG